jgi:hypothetical protein
MTREYFHQSCIAFKSWSIDGVKYADETYEVELSRRRVSPLTKILDIDF